MVLTKLWEQAQLTSIAMMESQPAWARVAPEFKRQLVNVAEGYLDFQWPALQATEYMEFLRTGNRARYEASYFARRQALASLVLAECLEGEERFLPDIINGIWAICEESSWVLPAHHNQFYRDGQTAPLPRVEETVIDLFAAETGVLLAWTKHLLSDSLTAFAEQVPERIMLELKRRILDVYLTRDDFWWMGLRETDHSLGNWVPWTTGNCLATFLLVERDGQRRLAATKKALRSLDVYLAHYSPDGGCDEGPSYWGRSAGSLFECLEMLADLTEGAFVPFDLDLIKRMGHYLRDVHIAGDYFVNFADGSAKAEVDGPLLYAYGQRIGDQSLRGLGAQLYQRSGLDGLLQSQTFSLGRVIRAALLHAELMGYANVDAPVSENEWLADLQVLTARQSTTPGQGFFLAAKGGHNGENHNHNDVGSCIVFYAGLPVIIDVGVETYTARTFSDQRYTIWTMQSEYHNLPIINGCGQSPGRDYAAEHVRQRYEDASSQVEMDLAPAYPKQAGLKSWRRSYTLRRQPEAQIVIADQYSLAWAESIQIVFILAQEPRLSGRLCELRAGDNWLQLDYQGAPCSISCQPQAISDPRLTPVWGDSIYRLIYTLVDPAEEGELCFTLSL